MPRNPTLPADRLVVPITGGEVRAAWAQGRELLDASGRWPVVVSTWQSPGSSDWRLPFRGGYAEERAPAEIIAAAGRHPRPRRMGLMIAAVASTNGLPLYTRNADDFNGLESAVTIVAV